MKFVPIDNLALDNPSTPTAPLFTYQSTLESSDNASPGDSCMVCNVRFVIQPFVISGAESCEPQAPRTYIDTNHGYFASVSRGLNKRPASCLTILVSWSHHLSFLYHPLSAHHEGKNQPKTTMSQTNVLITGGNRGLGLALVTRFLAQPNHVGDHPSILGTKHAKPVLESYTYTKKTTTKRPSSQRTETPTTQPLRPYPTSRKAKEASS